MENHKEHHNGAYITEHNMSTGQHLEGEHDLSSYLIHSGFQPQVAKLYLMMNPSPHTCRHSSHYSERRESAIAMTPTISLSWTKGKATRQTLLGGLSAAPSGCFPKLPRFPKRTNPRGNAETSKRSRLCCFQWEDVTFTLKAKLCFRFVL